MEFGKATIDSEVVENTADNIADMAIREIANVVPGRYLSTTVIEGMLERAKQSVREMSIASFQRYIDILEPERRVHGDSKKRFGK